MSIDRVTDPVKGRARVRNATGVSSRARPGDGPRPAERRPGAAAPLDGAALVAWLGRVVRVLERHRMLLDRLDAALGDGDHGENMSTGFSAVLSSGLEPTATGDLGALLRSAGHVLVSSVGGASGPLYGTAFIEAGFQLAGAAHANPPVLADALDAAVRGLARRGRCSLGDKTILDALQPAAVAFRSALDAGEPVERALRAAALAARHGMRATTPLIARRGLALRLGERSRGHQDPGATSCFLLVRAMLPPGPTAALGRRQ